MQPWRSGVSTSFSNGKRTGLWPVFNFFVWWVNQILTNLVLAITVGVPLPTRRTDLTITSNDEISSKHKALTSNLQNWKHMRKHQSTNFATPQLWYHFLGGWQIWPSHPIMKYHQNIRPYPTTFKTESTWETIKVLTLPHFCTWTLQLSYATMDPQCPPVFQKDEWLDSGLFSIFCLMG